jgi:hypothetical protein
VSAKVRIVVYTPANMNAIDGSSVWAQSITLALAAVPRVEVTLVLGHAVTNDRLLAPLQRKERVRIIEPPPRSRGGSLTTDEAAKTIARTKPQVLVVRGREAATRLAQVPALKGRLWPYLTDIPQRPEDVTTLERESLTTIMGSSPVILCQTDELASFLKEQFPETVGKTYPLPPAIPEGLTPNLLPPPTTTDLRLCYSGKFARQWNTYEMCDLPRFLAERGIYATVTMVGDKVNQDPSWPEFAAEMKRKLESSPGVEWLGGVSREQSILYMSQAHLGLSWRSSELDDSLELSTKLLEYCAVGTPPILNRTAMHERVFGPDYPLFVDADTDIVDLIEKTVRGPAIYDKALDQISPIPDEYTLGKTSARLEALVDTQFPRGASRRSGLWTRLAGRFSTATRSRGER